MDKYKTIDFKSWNSFKNSIEKLSSDWIFRGQSNSKWDLCNSFERSSFAKKYNNIEHDLVKDFKRGLPLFIDYKETPTSLIEYIALMQHYGVPTRLLDFTNSPYVASFFAFENLLNKSAKRAIWAININKLQNLGAPILYDFFKDKYEPPYFMVTEQMFEEIYSKNKLRLVFQIEPFQMNLRYFSQNSTFLSVGNTNESFLKQLEFLINESDENIIKFQLPSKIENDVLNDLKRMNINYSTLFPSLDGYSKDLMMKYHLEKNVSEYLISKYAENSFINKNIIK